MSRCGHDFLLSRKCCIFKGLGGDPCPKQDPKRLTEAGQGQKLNRVIVVVVTVMVTAVVMVTVLEC